MKFGYVARLALASALSTSCQTSPKPSPSESARVSAPAEPREVASYDWKSQPPIEIDRRAFDGSSVGFETHPSYLSLALPFPPLQAFRAKLETQLGESLVNRGESHVTVITPPEFKVLSSRLSMKEIESIARRESLQSAKLESVCLGRGRVEIEGREESTYFIVVKSEMLSNVRQKIRARFEAKGGARGAFDSSTYFPHVTVGFTKRDLHFEQGVVKDERSCLLPLALL